MPVHPTSTHVSGATTSLFGRLSQEGDHARYQLAWIIGLSALGGALVTFLLLLVWRALWHSEIAAFIGLAVRPGSAQFSSTAFWAILERIPVLGVGLVLAGLVLLLVALRYVVTHLHTFRRFSTRFTTSHDAQ